MSTRAIAFISVLGCAAAACGIDDEPQGTYHLALTRRPPEASEPRVPTTVSWPATAEMTLRFDESGHAQVTLLGTSALVSVQQPVTDGQSGSMSPVENGSLKLGINFPFDLLAVDDLTACPPNAGAGQGNYFELFILDGHVDGDTSGTVLCGAAPNLTWEAFVFDVTGDRVD